MEHPMGSEDNMLKAFHHLGYVSRIYKSMNDNDLADGVVASLDILLSFRFPDQTIYKKSDDESIKCREKGNEAYKNRNYTEAITYYNKALLYAPKKSLQMKLAYSNRSAVLMTIKAYDECLNDIESCLNMGGQPMNFDTQDRLNKRKHEAEIAKMNAKEGKALTKERRTFAKKYFTLQSRNPQISCLSRDVDVIAENGECRVVAANDIKVGTLVGIEEAYVCCYSAFNMGFETCFYCNKMCFNLYPCHGCYVALFCSETCRINCVNEYHEYECKIIHLMEPDNLAVKAAMKLKHQSKTWKQFIANSFHYGKNRMRMYTVEQIFNTTDENSILNFKDERHFIYGKMFQSSYSTARIIDYLLRKTDFMPTYGNEKAEAIRAFGRVVMFFSLYGVDTNISYTGYRPNTNSLRTGAISTGLFRLTGKLKHSCLPNTLVVGLNRSVALIALQPIKSGTELTISYRGNLLTEETPSNQISLFVENEILCNCSICKGEWYLKKDYCLTEKHLKYLNVTALLEAKNDFATISQAFPSICKTLAVLSDVPFSAEYKNIYTLFIDFVCLLQSIHTRNQVLK